MAEKHLITALQKSLNVSNAVDSTIQRFSLVCLAGHTYPNVNIAAVTFCIGENPFFASAAFKRPYVAIFRSHLMHNVLKFVSWDTTLRLAMIFVNTHLPAK